MRPLVMVIGLLLAGAALACSDAVPPPGATLSGSVWVDANANGVRDKCDPPSARASPRLELVGAGGETLETKAGKDGVFTFTEVPPGEYTLGVQQGSGRQWPVTAPSNSGTGARYGLELRGYENLEGLDFGVVGHDPLAVYPDEYGLFVVLFNDADTDGELDVDECTLEEPWSIGVTADGMGWSALVGELSIYKFEALLEPPSDVKLDYWMNAAKGALETLVPTRVDAFGCPEPVAPSLVPGSRLYRAEIAMRMAEAGTATIRARTFVDLDGDAVLDEGEQPAYLSVVIRGDCDNGPQIIPAWSEDGVYTFAGIPAGHWRVQLETVGQFPEFAFEPVSTTPKVVEFDIGERDEVSTEFGVSYPGAGFVRVFAFSDDNLNGDADAGEPPFQTAIVCYGERPALETGFCPGSTAADGTVMLGPLAPGAHHVWALSPERFPKPIGSPESTVITVNEGEIAFATIAVAP